MGTSVHTAQRRKIDTKALSHFQGSSPRPERGGLFPGKFPPMRSTAIVFLCQFAIKMAMQRQSDLRSGGFPAPEPGKALHGQSQPRSIRRNQGFSHRLTPIYPDNTKKYGPRSSRRHGEDNFGEKNWRDPFERKRTVNWYCCPCTPLLLCASVSPWSNSGCCKFYRGPVK